MNELGATEIIYQNHIREKRVITDSIYKNYRYMITDNGNNPCAYIQLPSNHVCSNLVIEVIKTSQGGYSELWEKFANMIPVHGGLTYADYDPLFKTIVWIGWDYAHYPIDYSGVLGDGYKKWTLEEIRQEVFEAIKKLIILNKSKKTHNKR